MSIKIMFGKAFLKAFVLTAALISALFWAKMHQPQVYPEDSYLENLMEGHECWRNDGRIHPIPSVAIAEIDARHGPEFVPFDKAWTMMEDPNAYITVYVFCK